MTVSDQLEAKFATLLAGSSSKRAVVLPMALFVLDELGRITANAIEEIAERLNLSESQVEEELRTVLPLRRRTIEFSAPALPLSQPRRCLGTAA